MALEWVYCEVILKLPYHHLDFLDGQIFELKSIAGL